MLSNKNGDLLTQFSTIQKLCRVTAYVRPFIKNCKLKSDDRTTGAITVEEYVDAEYLWIKPMQKKHFAEEVARCTSHL